MCAYTNMAQSRQTKSSKKVKRLGNNSHVCVRYNTDDLAGSQFHELAKENAPRNYCKNYP